MLKHIFMAMTNASEGKDAEFSTWYDEVHLGEVLATPGFAAVQRYQLDDVQLGTNHPYKFLAIYELETDDPQATLHALASGPKTPHGGLIGAAPMATLYTSMGPRVTKDDFKK